MAVIVVLERRVRSGSESAFLLDTARYFSGPGAPLQSRANLEIVRNLEDPRRFLYVASWSSRAAYEASLTRPGSPANDPRLEPGAPARFFEPLYRFEVAGVAGRAVACILFLGPPANAAERQALLMSYARVQDHRATGVLRCVVGREVERHANLLLVLQYRTPEDFARRRMEAGLPLAAQMEALGCTIERFYSRTILERDQDRQVYPLRGTHERSFDGGKYGGV